MGASGSQRRKVQPVSKTVFMLIAGRYSKLGFDYDKSQRWSYVISNCARRLVGSTEKSEFLQVLIELHSALFGSPSNRYTYPPNNRLLAADTVDLITGKKSTDVEGDWAKLEEYLRRC